VDALNFKVFWVRLDGALGPDLVGRNLAYDRGVETMVFKVPSNPSHSVIY